MGSCLVRPKQFFTKSRIAESLVSAGKLDLAEQIAPEATLDGPHLTMPAMRNRCPRGPLSIVTPP